jgi:hypothetical protein
MHFIDSNFDFSFMPEIERNMFISDARKIYTEAFRYGVANCIKELRKLGDGYDHERRWSHSRKIEFAPVELSDYLLINVLRKINEESN